MTQNLESFMYLMMIIISSGMIITIFAYICQCVDGGYAAGYKFSYWVDTWKEYRIERERKYLNRHVQEGMGPERIVEIFNLGQRYSLNLDTVKHFILSNKTVEGIKLDILIGIVDRDSCKQKQITKGD